MKKFLDTLVVTQKQLDDTVDNDVFWEIVPPYGISGQLFAEHNIISVFLILRFVSFFPHVSIAWAQERP